jgi:hypothetical protein
LKKLQHRPQSLDVLVCEVIDFQTIQIKYSDYMPHCMKRDDQFRSAQTAARNMPRKLIHIGYDQRFIANPGGSAYPFALCDGGAGHGSLEGAQNQSLIRIANPVKPNPPPAETCMEQGTKI